MIRMIKLEDLQKISKRVKSIEQLGLSYIINEKYEIIDDTIYYAWSYSGKMGDFPQWLFKVKEYITDYEYLTKNYIE